MVYSGLYPIDGSDYPLLREALDKLLLNDAALVYEPETSAALGFGFRVGFLGLLHLEIVRERLEREAGISLISTAPERRLPGGHGGRLRDHRDQPQRLARRARSPTIYEPVVNATIIAPSDYTGAIMELCQGRRGQLGGMDYLSRVPRRAALHAAARRDHLRLLRRAEVRAPAATPASTTPRPASRSRRWSRSTSCCRARRSTPSARSCTRTRPTATAS